MVYLIVFLGAGLGGVFRHAVNIAAARLLGFAGAFDGWTVCWSHVDTAHWARTSDMKSLLASWPLWALMSAGFAAQRSSPRSASNSEFATFIRTIVILLAAGMMVYITGNWQEPSSVSSRSWLFLVLSGLATGASWICYFRALKLGDAARVAPIDKLSVVFVSIFAVLFLGERLTLPNWLGVVMIAGGAVLVAYRA